MEEKGWGRREGERKGEKRTLATSTLLVPSSEARREVTWLSIRPCAYLR